MRERIFSKKTFTVQDKNNVITDDDTNDASVKKVLSVVDKNIWRSIPPSRDKQSKVSK